MQLAERAGARALAQPIEPAPEPEPKPAPSLDPHFLFNRLARLVKDLVAIKTRLAAGIIPDSPAPDTRSEAWQTLTDPRRRHIIRTLHEAIKTSHYPKSEHKALRHQIESRTETFLAADPDQTLPAGMAIITLCEELHLPFDIHQLPDEVLLPPGGTMPTTSSEPRDDLSFISGVHHPP
jgi:hypothetical protein